MSTNGSVMGRWLCGPLLPVHSTRGQTWPEYCPKSPQGGPRGAGTSRRGSRDGQKNGQADPEAAREGFQDGPGASIPALCPSPVRTQSGSWPRSGLIRAFWGGSRGPSWAQSHPEIDPRAFPRQRGSSHGEKRHGRGRKAATRAAWATPGEAEVVKNLRVLLCSGSFQLIGEVGPERRS